MERHAVAHGRQQPHQVQVVVPLLHPPAVDDDDDAALPYLGMFEGGLHDVELGHGFLFWRYDVKIPFAGLEHDDGPPGGIPRREEAHQPPPQDGFLSSHGPLERHGEEGTVSTEAFEAYFPIVYESGGRLDGVVVVSVQENQPSVRIVDQVGTLQLRPKVGGLVLWRNGLEGLV